MIDLVLHLVNLAAGLLGLRKAIQPAVPPAASVPALPTGHTGPVQSGGGAVAVGGNIDDNRAGGLITFAGGIGTITAVAGHDIAQVTDNRGQ